MKQAVIVDYLRTPFAKAVEPTSGSPKQGKFASLLPDDMVAALIAESLKRTGINPNHVEALLLGCVHQEAEQGLNLARMIVLNPEAGLPHSVGGISVDRFCGSSMHIIADAKNAIGAGEAEVMLCAGVQSISRIPMAGWNPMLNPKVYGGNAKGFMNMGITAENLAAQFQIDRAAQEAFALQSHQKAAQAQQQGHFDDEIMPLAGLSLDDSVRPDSSLEQLQKLKPAFLQDGTVTAGTSSPHTDGASLVVLASQEYAQEHQLPILARIKAFAGSGCEPEIMGIGPVNAIQKALQRAGLSMQDIGVVELNEAFAVQTLAVLQELDRLGLAVDANKLNRDGGAIALGHPLGASGARITGKVARLLQRTGQRYGLAAMCIGGGQGVAIVLENPNIS
ncbi:thiolase family protein [Vampirovibrio chlorellavorus]|uniref:thiolase family protein n=1 Tax=Vampirovibrio chlorellavorus TaxID=758823 RepID=UPI0026EE2CD0|nr:thiolase family protein [Vampirovibrio chlorellavorus]